MLLSTNGHVFVFALSLCVVIRISNEFMKTLCIFSMLRIYLVRISDSYLWSNFVWQKIFRGVSMSFDWFVGGLRESAVDESLKTPDSAWESIFDIHELITNEVSSN